MHVEWLPFQIDLARMHRWLQAEIPEADGITADEEGMTIIEREPFSSETQGRILDYLSSLTEQGEDASLSRPARLLARIADIREGLFARPLGSLTSTERKLLFLVPITEAEEDAILASG
jgi:hypothetical protein